MNRLSIFKPAIIVIISLIISSKSYAQLASDSIGCVPLLVSFSSPYDTLTKPVWDFKDGATSNKLQANHVFVTPGVYFVTLSNYNKLVATKKITVFARPEIQIAADKPEGCAPHSLVFRDVTSIPPGISVQGYLWDFGDGDGSELQSPSHTYTSVNRFSVTLNLRTNIEQCNVAKKFDQFITIKDKIDAGFSIDSISPRCQYPSYIYLKNKGKIDPSYSFTWLLGNGETSQDAHPAPIKIVKDSLYKIALKISTKEGCNVELNAFTDIVFNPFVTIQFEDTICTANQLKIVTTGNAKEYLWNFGPKASPSISRLANPIVQFNEEGIYDIPLTYTSKSGCKKDTSIRVYVLKKDAGFSFVPPTVCSLPAQIICTANVHNFTSYTWNNRPGKATDTIQLPFIQRDTFYYNKPDSVVVNLHIRDGNGCTADSTLAFHYALPNSQFEISEHEGVIPWTVYIKDVSESTSPIVKWIVSWGDGTVMEYDSISIKTAGHEYTVKGKYYINMWIINADGCEDKHFGAWVDAQDEPDFDGLPVCQCNCKNGSCSGNGGSISLCYKESFSVGLNKYPPYIDALHYNFGPTIDNCDQTFFINKGIMYNDPATYHLTATMENGGNFIELEGPMVTVHGPKAEIEYQVHCDGKYTVDFSHKSIDYTSVKWNVAGIERTEASFSFTFPGKGDYPVMLVAYNDQGYCHPDTTFTMIRLREPKAHIETEKDWCFNSKNALISSGSMDEVTGCKMGYVWTFPTVVKPTIVTDLDTIHTSLPPGKHRIILTVRDVNGCVDKDTAEVTSYYISAGFVTDAERICSPLNVTFTNASVHDNPIAQYIWSFQPDANLPQVSHVFENLQDAQMEIYLRIIDELGCESTASKTFTTYKPKATFTFPSVLCEGLAASFLVPDSTQNNSLLDYKWTIDDVAYSQKSRCEVPGFAPGKHLGQLAITEKSTQCTNAYNFEFYVTKQPEAVISELGDSVFCYPKTFQLFSDKSVIDPRDKVSYWWTYSNGRNSPKRNPVETFEKGEYTIKLRIGSVYRCHSEVEKKIKLIGPEGNFTMDKDQICKGDTIRFTMTDSKDVASYFWDFGQGEVNNNLPSVGYKYAFYPPSGSTFASLVLYGQEKNCQVVKSRPVKLYQVYASFIPDTVCGKTMQIHHKSQGVSSATWAWDNNKLQKMDSLVTIGVQKYGEYPLMLAIKGSQGNCKDTMTAMVKFSEPPTISLPASIHGCTGDTLTFAGNADYLYEFNPSGDIQVQDNQLSWAAASSKSIQIKATTQEGCSDSKVIRFNSQDVRHEELDLPLYACQDNWQHGLKVDSTASMQILWSTPGFAVENILSCVYCQQPTLAQGYSGPLNVTIKDKASCITRNQRFELFYPELKVPNVFSPNGDKNNDVFRPFVNDPRLEDFLVIHELKVFNRWGKVVYNGHEAWDGTTNGQPATAEVYYYTMTYSLGESCMQSVKGDVTLIR